MKNVRTTLIAVAAVAATFGVPAEAAMARVANDPEVPRMYALDSIRAPQAWDVVTGSASVKVATIDDGVDPRQTDLAPNLSMAGGYDFAGEDADASENGSNHGSQTASLLGSRGNNALGMAGVSWDVTLLPFKVRNDGPRADSNPLDAAVVARAFRFAGTQGARVANASFGFPLTGSSPSAPSAAEIDAVLAGLRASPETLFVVSAGNSQRDNDANPRFPCSFDVPNLICVAGTTQADQLWSASNFGATSVDLAAPALQVQTVTGRNTFGPVDGTSYSAPMVSGVAALYFARYPQATVADARAAILGGVDKLPALAGKTVTGGRLNAERTLAIAPTDPPSPPAPTPETSVPQTGGTATAPPPVVVPPPTATVTPRSSTPATVTVARRQKLRTVLRSGLRVSVAKAAGRRFGISLRVTRSTARRLRVPTLLGTATRAGVAGRKTVGVRFRRAAAKSLAKTRRATIRVTVKVSAGPTATRPTTVVRTVVLY